ncbi:MAG TPA: saccharopine dehydrogenase C-terminal domain-containing protein, partial [Chitinophagaceae bacterium]|nr:saccharopine dehydrogenase C-terminal domain-containing protein [Chitinophagaceae bacterium]
DQSLNVMQIAVLGAGMVGQAIAIDLAKDFEVTSFDLNPANLQELHKRNKAIKTLTVNLNQYEQFEHWLAPYDLVVTAVPGYIGYQTLEAVIKAGKNVVDISFFPEDALQLDHLAKEKGVTVITDCGVAPGMSNLILGRYNKEMEVTAFECYVGGLPKERKPPFEYKAPFSPVDVIQEYIRPARLVEKGKIVTKPALSERELMKFEKAGELEAFNTDGLRSLVHTMIHIPDMKEKTLRYPGHIDLIIALQQAGFFDTTPLRFNQTEISPLDFTSRILLKEWKLEPGEEEFTVMKVIVIGKNKTITWDLYDQYDPVTRTSSMARTTGYTCTAAVHLITDGLFNEKGVFPPELIGDKKECFDSVMLYLKKRGVNWMMKES